jgi:hypothetical protein
MQMTQVPIVWMHANPVSRLMSEAVPAAQQFWWVGPLIAGLSLLVSSAALCAIIWFNWGQHRYRAYRQRTAGFNVFLTYGPDDTKEVRELRLPANSEVMVQLRIRPTIQYQQIEVVFGCHGSDITRPVPLRVLNRFIKHGVNREQSPDTHASNYIDKDDHYHIKETVDRSPPSYSSPRVCCSNRKSRFFPGTF